MYGHVQAKTCNKLTAKIRSDVEKHNYKQTHIPIAISL